MTKEFKSQLKTMETKHKEEMAAASKEWKAEKQELKQKYKKEMTEPVSMNKSIVK